MRAFLILGAAFVALSACTPVKTAEPVELAQRCDPAAGQSLVGSHVGAVDFASNANVRIICTTCPATMDYRAERTNIRFNEKTGIIEKVDCG
ncbi:Peptidase inhibitor I78 family protein [compost metagenome]